jgi:hypothetical protein
MLVLAPILPAMVAVPVYHEFAFFGVCFEGNCLEFLGGGWHPAR